MTRATDAMSAITVHQPFATAIARFGKDVENRSWPAPARLVGKPLAIHAGKRWLPPHPVYPDITLPTYEPALYPAGAVLAVATLAACCTAGPFGGVCSCGKWAIDGQCHWWLTDVHLLPKPVPARGAQRIWRLPPEVAARVQAQLNQRREATL